MKNLCVKKLTNIVFVLMLLIIVNKAVSQDFPVINVETFYYTGSGCPVGSAIYTLSTDAQAVTILFSDFISESYGTNNQDSKDCYIVFKLRANEMWSYSITGQDIRGYVRVDEKAIVNIKGGALFNNKPFFVSDFNIKGPVEKDYLFSSRKKSNWSACSNIHFIRFFAYVNTKIQAPQASALATVDSIDGVWLNKFLLEWKKCK